MTPVAPVGIIANPASGKDIRRLVAHGSTFDNGEKVNITRRILLGMNALGVREVVYMPDTFDIVGRALHGIQLSLAAKPIEMAVFGDAEDTRAAARQMQELGISCIVTLGGDGTNRVVVGAAPRVPLLAVSTGTNNVFPVMVEGTLAGFAAASYVRGAEETLRCRPLLEIRIDGRRTDIALADVVRSSQSWTGSRAVWRPEHIQEIVTSHIPQAAIGVCGLGCALHPDQINSAFGVHARTHPDGRKVLCAIGPGLPLPLGIASNQLIEPGGEIELGRGAGTLALDGEREIELLGNESVTVTLVENAVQTIDVDFAIATAAKLGLFDLDGKLG